VVEEVVSDEEELLLNQDPNQFLALRKNPGDAVVVVVVAGVVVVKPEICDLHS